METSNPDPINFFYWLPLISVFIANGLLFIIAQLKNDNSIVDIMWGILFIIPNTVILLLNKNWNERTILVYSLVAIWGLRLALHIGARHKGEDYRY